MQTEVHEHQCYLRKIPNPYNEKLKSYNQFVFLDQEAESLKGLWNDQVFLNPNPLVVEIGVGYGDFMANYCQNNPTHNYVGLDIRFKRSLSVAKKLHMLDTKNFRLLRAQGQRLSWLFEKNEIDHLFCFFPDPWPKQKQHKKRIFQRSFLQQLGCLVKKTGIIHFKTDHLEMFNWVLKELEGCSNLKLHWKSYDLYHDYNELTDAYTKNLLFSMVTFQTKFEKIFLQQKIPIKALILCPQ